MNSAERRERRYQRRKKRREEKKWKVCRQYDDFEKVFSYGHLYAAYRKCRRGVSWKASVQKFITQAPLLIFRIRRRLLAGKFRSKGFYEFDILERGKLRHIKSVTIEERVVQRCLCDYALVPMLSRRFIYDNGASLKNKGYHFTMDRLEQHLQEFYQEHGTDGAILIYDFHGFFDSIEHEICTGANHMEFTDRRMIWISDYFVECFGDERGLGLGSQVSQTYALEAANPIDHLVKEDLRIHQYARYMDDGYLISHDKEYLKACLTRIEAEAERLGLELNRKKTGIIKLSHGFTFMKARFRLTEDGKVVKKIYKHSVTAERRKLKKLRPMMDAGKLEYPDIRASFESWYAYAEHFDARNARKSMTELFNSLFLQDFIHGSIRDYTDQETPEDVPFETSLLIYEEEKNEAETEQRN